MKVNDADSIVKNWKRAICVLLMLSLATLLSATARAQTPLANGASQAGTLLVNTTNSYTLTANAGDNIVLRLGTTGFDGNLNLFGPTGALLKNAHSGTDAELDYTATNSGTFTALVSSYFSAGIGTYVLHLAQFPEAFIVPAGDEGGPMTGVTHYYGTITQGDLDMWSFTACSGDSINLQLNPTNFTGNLDLYGSKGALLKTAASATAAVINYTATNTGPFTVLVSSYFSGGTGTYGLAVNELPDGLKLCFSTVSGGTGNIAGVGGSSNATYIVFTHTNVNAAFAQWTPIRTNQFDSYGVFSYTNAYNPAEPRRFFRLKLP